MTADRNRVSKETIGRSSDEVGVELEREHEGPPGPDLITLQLGGIAKTFEDIQRTRKAADQRAATLIDQGYLKEAELQSNISEALKKTEAQASRALKRLMGKHILWPWLEPLKGLSGPLTGRLIAVIRDPRRFPGQRCTHGHTQIPELPVHSRCPNLDREGEPCPGIMHAPRPHSGVRSVWHYLGLHAVEGKSPRKSKGQQADWHLIGRSLCLQPDGLAAQIVKHRTPRYRGIYDEKKLRLLELRGIAIHGESEARVGAAEFGAGVAVTRENENGAGLRPIQIEGIARKVAVKAFVGDLLMEWKRLLG